MAGRPRGMKHTTESRYLMGATRLGIDPMAYRERVEAGLRWCFRCQAWQPVEQFGTHRRTASGIDSQCKAAARAYAREYQRRKRAAEKARRAT